MAADGDERDRLRQVMVGVFSDLGQNHPLALRYPPGAGQRAVLAAGAIRVRLTPDP